MCGIAGVIGKLVIPVEDVLSRMNHAQAHRGPDHDGTWHRQAGENTVGLAHRRLSILDLSPCGNQPMVHPQTGDVLVFNGEIYNFVEIRDELESLGEKFRGHSDTEVLLHALSRWGARCLERIAGMYAFGFYSERDQTVLLARDPLGIKPLYYANPGQALLFSSELRAILSTDMVPRHLDQAGVAGLLAYGAVQQPNTIVQGICMMPPGHYAAWHLSGQAAVKPTMFWSYPMPSTDRTEPDAVNAIRRLLERSVREHMIADVPVGVFLSSGLDSTVIAAIAGRQSSHVRSFTVAFGDQPDMSEGAMAAETAGLFNLEHTEVVINGPEAESATLQWVKSLDQPSLDGLNVFVISQAVRREGIKVALSGQGGDELFGGYPSFADVPRLARVLRFLRPIPKPARRLIGRMAMAGRSRAVGDKLMDILDTDGSVAELYFQRRRAMSNRQLRRLGVHPQTIGLTASFQSTNGHVDRRSRDAVWLISQLESRYYQGNMLLRDSDANAMAHGLEIRVPMLDQRLAHYVLGLPGYLRLPSGRADKHLLRVAFAPDLRPDLLRQAKRGFTLPIRRWMLGPLKDLCRHGLLSLKQVGMLDPAGIDRIWRQFEAQPESPIWSRAFTLAILGTYLQQHRIGSHA